MSCIRSEDSRSRERFLRTLQEDDDGLREFAEDIWHERYKDDEEEAGTKGAQYSHG